MSEHQAYEFRTIDAPPIPPRLAKLTMAQKELTAFLGVDPRARTKVAKK